MILDEQCNVYNCKNARQVFESFGSELDMRKGERSNYLNPDIHNIYISFKNWYKTTHCVNCIGEQ